MEVANTLAKIGIPHSRNRRNGTEYTVTEFSNPPIVGNQTKETKLTAEQSDSQARLSSREYAKKTRERRKANIAATEKKLNNLLNELKYLRTLAQENATALQILSLNATVAETDGARSSSDKNDISSVTIGAVYQSSNGYNSSGSVLPIGAGELRGARATDILLSSILSTEAAPFVEMNPEIDALEKMNMLIRSSEITDDTQKFLQILSQRRFAMPKELQLLPGVSKDDPVTYHLFQKERNRLHAKLTRDRKRLLEGKLVQVVQNLEESIKNLRRGLAEARAHVPLYSGSDSGATDEVSNGDPIEPSNGELVGID